MNLLIDGMSLLNSTQRAELIAQLVAGGLKRTTAGPVTTEFQPPTTSELLRVLQADAAETAANTSRPFRLQTLVSPGA